ncbi:complex 1 lyr protein [Byssothecium circinans]|uniref:LYR motif-containing protein 2 n=1 Tax=Byssothecium circinans TaxID=147558 RepID=A0A6A5TYK9_9PLEO|nr:complex 1 lyr protein [Byssothecium circinans]
MKAITRAYATVASPSRLRLRGKTPMSLDHFIQRQRALALWKDIVRSTASISDVATKKEMRDFARTEFARHRHETDLSQIRYLISHGKTQVDQMKSTLINSGLLS